MSSYPPPSTTQSSNSSWEELRRNARQLESIIETKLVAYSRLASSGNIGPMSDTAENEIEELLRKLSTTTTDLSNLPPSSNPTQQHILQRHRDVYTDFLREFQKTRSHVAQLKERQALLEGWSNNQSQNEQSGMTEYLLGERMRIEGSHRAAEEVIEMANDTRSSLLNQRTYLNRTSNRMGNIATRFPIINTLVGKIRTRKQKETLCLALVISLCLIFLIWFKFLR